MLAAVGLCGLLPRPARAEPATAQIESTKAAGAADCPDAARLARAVNDGIGRVAVFPAGPEAPAARLQVGVTFERAAHGYTATVKLGGARGGTRKLSGGGPGCDALANAVSVLLTVVLDSDAGAPGDVPASGGGVAPIGATGALVRDGSGAGMNANVGFGGGVAEGLVGGWSPALGVAGTFAYRHWAARVGGLWLPSKTSDTFPARVEVGLTVARLAFCVTTADDRRSRVTLGLCAQQQIGWMRGSGIDFRTTTATDDRLWLATGAAFVASGALERSFGWEVEVGAVRLLRQQRFVVDAFGTAYASDPFAFMTTLSFMTRVW